MISETCCPEKVSGWYALSWIWDSGYGGREFISTASTTADPEDFEEALVDAAPFTMVFPKMALDLLPVLSTAGNFDTSNPLVVN